MIHVIDYGAGNVGSVLNMIGRIGAQATAVSERSKLATAEKILLPGVGSFDNAMLKLRALGFAEIIMERAAAGVPLLGICLGMQLLASGSEEGHERGLGLVPGFVRRLPLNAAQPSLKVPHMGWNRVVPLRQSPLIQGLDESSRFYFVHSYYFECEALEDRLLETTHGITFVSGVERQNVMGVQFHPEKSHRFGLQLLKNFVER